MTALAIVVATVGLFPQDCRQVLTSVLDGDDEAVTGSCETLLGVRWTTPEVGVWTIVGLDLALLLAIAAVVLRGRRTTN
ncbi:MAG TPA: hypothetical protein VHJ34_12565 [Actinomycetota bacterium]|nr:hypothetical protein [Actinomycetota bacterium]